MTGNPLGDRYQMGETLGFGGMSEVYRGRDVRLGRDVAIKVLRADLARDPTFQTRFRREAQNAASLNHPAIVSVYDTGEMLRDGATLPYIVMEFVDGETLRDLVKREGPLPAQRAMEITADICAALDFSHRHGIIHRDVKPANVMLTRSGAVKVMDFGIARAVTDGQATVTATAAVIGTAQYLSPEQARGEAVDARSDVYATGCVLYELLTGEPPFTGDSPVAVAYQHVREDPRPPSSLRSGISRELDAIVLTALNKNPLNRYQSAADMRSDLVRALSGQAVHATPVMNDADRTALLGAAIAAPPPHTVAVQRPGGVSVAPTAPRILDTVDDGYVDPEEHSRRIWGFVGIAAVCLVLLAGAIYLTLQLTSSEPKAKPVRMPDLMDKTQEQVTAELRDIGLTLATPVTVAASPADKAGLVIDQDPSEGTIISPDDDKLVHITIGSGEDQVAVPNVQNMEASEAQAALQKVDLVYAEEQIFSPTAKGRVDHQEPDVGVMVPRGSTVTVYISKGTEQRTVPSADQLIGVPASDAQTALEDAGLTARIQPTASSAPKDEVLELGPGDPPPGESVPIGTVITLVTSDNSMMKMPSLANLKKSEVFAALSAKDVGWEGQENQIGMVDEPVKSSAQWGRVVDQVPAAGEEVSKKSVIKVSIGVEPVFTMPDLGGMTESEVKKALKDAGWLGGEFKVITENGETPPDGKEKTVIPDQQSPAPDAKDIKATAPITIHVYPKKAPPETPSSTQSEPPGPPEPPDDDDG